MTKATLYYVKQILWEKPGIKYFDNFLYEEEGRIEASAKTEA